MSMIENEKSSGHEGNGIKQQWRVECLPDG